MVIHSRRAAWLVVMIVLFSASRAQAQPGLRLAVSGGAAVPSGRDEPFKPGADTSLGTGAIVVVDLLAASSCCNEWYASGFRAQSIGVNSLSGGDTSAHVSPSGFALGMNHRWWRSEKDSIWAGPLVGAFFSTRATLPNNAQTPLRLPTTWGYGGQITYRRRINDVLSAAGTLRFQLTTDVAFNPYIVTGGIVVRLSNVP